jgi:hypothetical protein
MTQVEGQRQEFEMLSCPLLRRVFEKTEGFVYMEGRRVAS